MRVTGSGTSIFGVDRPGYTVWRDSTKLAMLRYSGSDQSVIA